MTPLHLAPVLELARRVRAREVSSRELVEHFVSRIERVNPALNAVVRRRYDAARAEAARADERTARDAPGDLPLLHGVPCTIKESFALEGMPHTAGLVARRDVVASRDATTVARLRAAGAIPLGVTNTSELCMWMESANKLYGRTNNAYDPRRTAGGSSGGEGAIVGAGASPFGLAADIGGSTRMPAFFNGVFGHKATGGLIPGTGQFPSPSGPALRYVQPGPIVRHARDLMPLVRAMAGPDGEDPGCEPMALGDPATVDVRGLRVLDARDCWPLGVDDELCAAQERAASALSRRGARVERVNIPALRRAVPIWGAMLGASGGPTYADLLGEGRPVNAGWEFLRWATGRSPYTLPSLGLVVIERAVKRFERQTRELVAAGAALRAEMAERLGRDGVMLFPSHTRPAPRHMVPLVPPVQWGFTAIFNVLELPVTQVPLGIGRRGVPLGVQVVGRHGNDHVTIAVAEALEDEFGGWVVPPTFS